MKVELQNIRMGHAPDQAECSTKGMQFRFDEKLLFGQPSSVVKSIQEKSGQLPVGIASKVAKNGCPQFNGGECKLRNNGVCTF